MTCPLVLYDPTERNNLGGGKGEAQYVAGRLGGNIAEIPFLESGMDVLPKHNGHLVLIAHGNSASEFTKATIRKNPPLGAPVRVGAAALAGMLEKAGLFQHTALPYRIELYVCRSASGYHTFAAQFYKALTEFGLSDLIVKAPVGDTSLSTAGSASVSYWRNQSAVTASLRTVGWTLLTVPRFFANRMPNMPNNFVSRHNIMLHDWVFYPPGMSF